MTKPQDIEVSRPSLPRTRGRSLWEDLDLEAMQRQIEELGRMADQLDRESEDMTRQISSLDGQVERLVQSSESDVYQTQEGDATTDAFLFDRDQRSDTSLYRELYGLEYRKVLELQSM